jgi:hypothetical protein
MKDVLDFCKSFVVGVLIGAVVFLAVEYGKNLLATRVANAAVDAVVPAEPLPLEIEIQPPAVPAEVVAPATVDYGKVTRERRVLAYSAGLLAEAMANATSGYTPGAAFSKSFLKQVGVQVQVAVLEDADFVSREPALAFAQGFLIGL